MEEGGRRRTDPGWAEGKGGEEGGGGIMSSGLQCIIHGERKGGGPANTPKTEKGERKGCVPPMYLYRVSTVQ